MPPCRAFKSKFPVRKSLPPVFLTLSLLFIYLASIAPGLTWANDGADGGDLISAAATAGIAHPSGYPTYLLLARLFQLLPIGSLAFRTNLMSALAGVLASLLVYGLLVWVSDSPAHDHWLAGLIAGFSFGLAPMLWSQAVITEVYTLHTALCALVMLLTLWKPGGQSRPWSENLSGLALGLAIGNQLTAVFLIAPVLLISAWRGKWKFNVRSLLRVCAGLCAGLLVYSALPLRALSNPPVNWGNPSTLEQFKWLVSGELYQSRLLNLPPAGVLERCQALATLLLHQFELPGIVLGLVGLIYYFKPSRLYFFTILNVISFSLFAILYASFDSYIYLLPAFLSFGLWIGLGADGLLQSISKYQRQARIGLMLLISIWFLAAGFTRWPEVDAAHDTRAEQFGAHAMQSLPQNAIVFVDSDRAIFGLWYFQYALKQRPDITVIATELLGWDWYIHTLRSTYPALDWSAKITWSPSIIQNNPGHPICQVSYWNKEEISCNSGINTSP